MKISCPPPFKWPNFDEKLANGNAGLGSEARFSRYIIFKAAISIGLAFRNVNINNKNVTGIQR
jgi:hypothetical protein